MYTALSIFGSLAGLLGLGISLFNYVRSSHHRDVINVNAEASSQHFDMLSALFRDHGRLDDKAREIEQNLRNVMEIGNHNDELVKASFEIVGQSIDQHRAWHNEAARDLGETLTLVAELDTRVSELQERLLQDGQVLDIMLDTQGVQANCFDMFRERLEALEKNALHVAEYRWSEVQDAEFAEVAEQVTGARDPMAPDAIEGGQSGLEVAALKSCGFGVPFSPACPDCLTENALPADIQDSLIHNDGIKDPRYLQVVRERDVDYRERIGEQLRADKERGAIMPSLPANLLPAGTMLVKQGGEVAYYFPEAVEPDEPNVKAFADVIPPEAMSSVAEVIAEKREAALESNRAAYRALGTGTVEEEKRAADIFNREFGIGDNQVIV